MYQDSVILMSALPEPIVTYDSIVYPFDHQVWGFTFACIISQFLLLQVMQYVYCKVSGTPNHIEYIYGGAYYVFINSDHIQAKPSFVSDIFIATEFIPRRRLKKWINRNGFGIRKVFILKWVVLGSVLTWGYKSTLLSTLVTIRYNKPIDTLTDLDRAELPLVMQKDSWGELAFENEQRDITKRIYSRRILSEVTQQSEAKYAAMYSVLWCIIAKDLIMSQFSGLAKIWWLFL